MDKKEIKNKNIPGIVSGNLQSAENFAENVPFLAARGHGFAAERANHLFDKLSGKDAHIIGGDNAKNGADRLVDNVKIQTKFCNGGGKCISECFENGKLRYWDGDVPMKIEVPKDFFEAAKQAFAERVKRGEVVDITGMSKAEIDKLAKELSDETIKGSPFTYAQARNIAKFGTIESLTYDAVNGIKLAGTAMGITAVISFAQAVWSGENFDIALKEACYSGLKVGGITWISSIITAQVGRTATSQALRPATDWVIKQMGSKAASAIANTLRIGSKPIYGAAAANSASKLLRGNIVTGVVTVAVLSSVDFYKMFQGKVSGSQVFKNVTNTAAGVASGTAGWAGGAAAGAALGSFLPGVGTAVGGVIGGILGSLGGGWLGSKASSVIMDEIITDDSKEMQDILGRVFGELAEEYLLSQNEAELISEKLSEDLSIDNLQNMYRSSSRSEFARNLIEPYIISEVKKRKLILNKDLPSINQLADEIENILEEELSN
ncbi:hypothetical protein [Haemophilus haemolyticus]|uniref:hypothetical protein n=1 Tax=Haemophilus haemolyticus TaxID=726 RepID=UPI00195E4E22|nr:hypothetical protein [Haemophilus haemolyticus]